MDEFWLKVGERMHGWMNTNERANEWTMDVGQWKSCEKSLLSEEERVPSFKLWFHRIIPLLIWKPILCLTSGWLPCKSLLRTMLISNVIIPVVINNYKQRQHYVICLWAGINKISGMALIIFINSMFFWYFTLYYHNLR